MDKVFLFNKDFRKKWLFLGLITLVAFFLRVYNIPETLLFHFDQGYHGLAIGELWESKRILLLGHKTDVEGIFHGSAFYYFMLPFYLISSWNPVGVSILLAALDAFSVVFVFLIGRHLFNKKVGYLAAIIYAVSYSLISYSRWLSNVTPIPFFSSAFFYFLLRSKLEKGIDFRSFSLACFIAGFLTQLNGAIGFFFLPILSFSVITGRKQFLRKKKLLLLSIFIFTLPILPLLFFEARHDFLVSRSVFRLFFHEGNTGADLGKITQNYLKFKSEFINLFAYKIPWLAGITFLLVVYAIVKERLVKGSDWKGLKSLLILLLIPLWGLIFYQGGIHGFFFVGIFPMLVVLIAWSFWYFTKIKFLYPFIVLLVGFIVFVNLGHWQGFLKPSFNLVPIGTRNLITLEDRVRALDFMYTQSKGEPFQTKIYIIPYFQEQPWNYVFSWYGEGKYGYLPKEGEALTFVIYEPDYDFPYRLTNWLGKIEEEEGSVVASFKSHDLTVERREK